MTTGSNLGPFARSLMPDAWLDGAQPKAQTPGDLALHPLTTQDAEQVRLWRNADLSSWRTPYLLTEEMQQEWYRDVVCNRNSLHRFWAVSDGSRLVGMVGLTNIDWQNRIAEVNLIMTPDAMPLGERIVEAVDLLLEQAFDYLGLATVCGECYKCSSLYTFWMLTAERYGAYTTTLPRRKFWRGQFWDSLYLSIDRTMYEQNRKG